MPYSLGLLTDSANYGLAGFSDPGNRRRIARLIALQVKSYAGLPNDDHLSVAFSAGVRVQRHSNTSSPTNAYVKKCVKSECGELVKSMMRTIAVEIEARTRNWRGPDSTPAAVRALDYYCQLARFREASTPNQQLQSDADRKLTTRVLAGLGTLQNKAAKEVATNCPRQQLLSEAVEAIRRTVRRYQLNPADQEDVEQAAILRFWQKIDAYREDRGSVSSYAAAIAKSAVQNWFRKRKNTEQCDALQEDHCARSTTLNVLGRSFPNYDEFKQWVDSMRSIVLRSYTRDPSFVSHCIAAGWPLERPPVAKLASSCRLSYGAAHRRLQSINELFVRFVDEEGDEDRVYNSQFFEGVRQVIRRVVMDQHATHVEVSCQAYLQRKDPPSPCDLQPSLLRFVVETPTTERQRDVAADLSLSRSVVSTVLSRLRSGIWASLECWHRSRDSGRWRKPASRPLRESVSFRIAAQDQLRADEISASQFVN